MSGALKVAKTLGKRQQSLVQFSLNPALSLTPICPYSTTNNLDPILMDGSMATRLSTKLSIPSIAKNNV